MASLNVRVVLSEKPLHRRNALFYDEMHDV